MAAQLLLINPKKRRRSHKRRARSHRRRRHVARRRRSRVMRVVRVNPRHRRRHSAHRRHIRRNPLHRHRRRIHRNPMTSVGGVVRGALIPAGYGAVGAVGVSVIWGFLSPMFGSLFSGNLFLNTIAKGAGSLGLGWAASKVLGRQQGYAVAIGGLTVAGYELLSSLLNTVAPTLPMAGVGAYMPPVNALGAYMPPQLGAYMPPGMGALPLRQALPVRIGMGGVGATTYNPAPYLKGMGMYDDMPYGSSFTGMGGLDGLGELQGSTGMGMF